METIQVDVDARGIAYLTLDQPDRHNALSAQMIREITETVRRLGGDPAVRVLVLTGQGRSFCAGGDLGWMRAQISSDRATRVREAMTLARMFQELNTCPKPVIGKVQGNAFGGGVGLIATCDVVIASNSAQFALTETRLGLIPATIGPYLLARIGETMARRVVLSGRRFDAAEAEHLGLLTRVVALADLEPTVEEEIVQFLQAAPGAIADAKAQLRNLGPKIDVATIAESVEALVRRWDGTEAPEGITAFFDKRPADWVPPAEE